ncbi:hypothetical protein HNR44_001140 [Geomicrobium halophilum]|uniref:Uncharacterized protein n=1 Tax=Geomicrobium halophilum TaxID=549000 RepID=A0A841PSC2_9BACL|nr:hypothetical protein [Geomicrobium halophilum]MBB6449191.1 hypothetical protein [Geomicrobium halophilum]
MQDPNFPMKVFSRWFTNDTCFVPSALEPVKTREKDYWMIRFPIRHMTEDNIISYTDGHHLYLRFQQMVEEKQKDSTTGSTSAYQAVAQWTTYTPLPQNIDEENYEIFCSADYVDVYFKILKGDDFQ